VVPDGGGDAAAIITGQAHADEVVGVARVRPGAGGAAGGAARAPGRSAIPPSWLTVVG
jgi:hypothetical protein